MHVIACLTGICYQWCRRPQLVLLVCRSYGNFLSYLGRICGPPNMDRIRIGGL